jgi:hypothetical protein
MLAQVYKGIDLGGFSSSNENLYNLPSKGVACQMTF